MRSSRLWEPWEIRLGTFQEWKQEQEKSAESRDRDEDEWFDDGEE
jgi:hypothetical protein